MGKEMLAWSKQLKVLQVLCLKSQIDVFVVSYIHIVAGRPFVTIWYKRLQRSAVNYFQHKRLAFSLSCKSYRYTLSEVPDF